MSETSEEPKDLSELFRLRRLKELKRHNGLAFYQPHSKQAKFHAAAKFKRRYLRTGNRFGKSTCGAAEDVSFAIGRRLWLPKDDPLSTLGIPRRSTKGLIIVADWDKAREVFTNQSEGTAMGKLFRLIPTKAFKGIHKNQAGEIDCIYVESLWGGISTIYIDTVKSFLSNPMGQESSDWDWIHVDEPIPREMWVANSRGLIDRSGSAWFTCTSITQPWINEMFIPKSNIRGTFDKPWENDRRSTWVMTGSSYDNETLPKEAIDRFAEELNANEREARIYGGAASNSGLVYTEFDRSRQVYYELPHGWSDFDKIPDNYTLRYSIDPHPSTPHAVLFAATAPTGQVYFWSEIFHHCLISELCDLILERTHHRTPHLALCDPIAFNPDPNYGTTWADTFWAKGIPVAKAPKDLQRGLVATKQALSQPDFLYFSSSLSTTLYEFDSYIWDPKKPNNPLDKNDHMMECLYRLVISDLSYVDPSDKDSSSVDFHRPPTFDGDLSIPTFKADRDWLRQLTSQ